MAKPWFRVWAQRKEKGTGRTLVLQVQNSEKRTRLGLGLGIRVQPNLLPNSEPAWVRSLEKGTSLSPTLNQGSARSFLWTSNLLNQDSALSKLQTCQGSEFRERNWPFSKLRTCKSSEIGKRNLPFSKLSTCQTKVQPGPLSEPRTCQTRVRPSPCSEL